MLPLPEENLPVPKGSHAGTIKEKQLEVGKGKSHSTNKSGRSKKKFNEGSVAHSTAQRRSQNPYSQL